MTEAKYAKIPVIDFAPFWLDDPAGQRRVVEDIHQACRQVGFLYLTHHGIPQSAIDQAFQQAQRFFALPLTEKMAIAWASEQSNRGYVGLERERLDETQPGDLKEAFNLGKEPDAAEATPTDNRWPQGQADFRPVMTDFFDHCAAAAQQIFRAFALALQMPEDYLAVRHVGQNFTLRLLHYPPLAQAPKPGQIRAGAHSDYGTLTLLFQDEVGGLEVLNRNGDWMAAPAIPGAVLMNTGDMTERWSNDVFRSTKHRVGLPQGEMAGRDRYSIAFFANPMRRWKFPVCPPATVPTIRLNIPLSPLAITCSAACRPPTNLLISQSLLQPCPSPQNLPRQHRRPKAVVDIDYANARRTGIEHRQQRREPLKASPIANAGGHRHNRTVCQPRHHAGQSPFHARHHNQHIHLAHQVLVAQQPM